MEALKLTGIAIVAALLIVLLWMNALGPLPCDEYERRWGKETAELLAGCPR